MSTYSDFANEHTKEVNDVAVLEGAASFTADTVNVYQYTYNNVAASGVVNVTHSEDTTGVRLVQVYELDTSTQGLTNTSLDFDLADEDQFIQEDATNGTDFDTVSGSVSLHATSSGTAGTYTERFSMYASDIAAGDYYGTASALSSDGSVMAVTSYRATTNAAEDGKAYVYDWNGSSYVERGTLVLASPGSTAHYGTGCALSADGTILAIGANAVDNSGTDNGSVFVYDWNGSDWDLRSTLTHPTAASYDYYGMSCSLSADGSRLVVGCSHDDQNTTNAGSVLTYEWNGSSWSSASVFLDSTRAGYQDYFGYGVALSGDGTVLAVGAPGDDTAGTDAGIVYVYDWNGSAWVYRDSILASAADQRFGEDLALTQTGDKLLVGSRVNNAVDVYVQDGGSWSATSDISSSTTNTVWYGWGLSVSSDGTVAAVGAPTDDTQGTDAGKLFVYDYIPPVSYPTTPYYVTTSDQNQISLTDVAEINSLSITTNQPANTDVKVLTSFDGRTTWKTYNGGWTTVSGMDFTNATISGLESGFTNYDTTSDDSLDFAFQLSTTSSSATPSIAQVTINYDELGRYCVRGPSEYGVKNKTKYITQVTNLSQNTHNIKVNILL